jgi:predicted ATPase
VGLPPDQQAAFIADVSAMAVRKAEADLLAESDPIHSTPTRLPKPPTVLFGRETDVASAVASLDPSGSAVRMLTLIGPGGVGKTRLALAVADVLGQTFADGVVFVDLCAVRDHRLVPATIARALDVRESPGRSARELILDYLRDRQTLIVLDNLEQVLGTAPMLAELLATCERISLLATSRGPLRIRAEQRFAVGPLEVPPHGASKVAIAESAAVQMFVDRARGHRRLQP